MKTLCNNRGVALVVLVIAMTLIAVLGAGFVALVGSKHKGFLYQRDSYRAFNCANAGVEYAIRYVADSTDSTGNNLNDFFHSSSIYSNIKVVSTTPDLSNLDDTSQWKRFDFGEGRFYLSYYLNPSYPNDIDDNKVLYSVGVVGEARKVVKLKNFLIYPTPTSSSGLDILNLVPNNSPYISGNYVVVPVINLTTSNITVSSIQFEIDLDNGQSKEFTDIYVRSVAGSGGTNIYNYFFGAYWPICTSSPAPASQLPCGQWSFVEVPDVPVPHSGLKVTNQLSVSASVPGSCIRWFSFRFNEAGSNLKGTYTITFNFSGGRSIIKFYV